MRPIRTASMLFVVALIVRLAFGMSAGLGRPPVEDENAYVNLARSVQGLRFEQRRTFDRGVEIEGGLRTHLRKSDFERARIETHSRRSFRGPVAPIALAFGGSVAGMRLLSIVLGALGAPLLYFATRDGVLGERAWWPAAAYALWPPAIYLSAGALSEAPSQALLLAAIATLCIPRPRGGAFAGALAALAVLARPAALIPAALLAFATGTRKRAALFVVAFVVVMSPWVLRNWAIHGRPLLTTNSGVTLVGGNSQAALDAEHPGKWAAPERVYAGAEEPPDLGMWGWSKLSEEASDRRFASDALSWVRENPGSAAKLCFWKLVRLLDPDQHSEKADAGAKAWIGWLTFAPVLLLALAGLGAWRTELPWTLLLLGTIATALLFYGDVRMRTCADPALLVFAAHGALRLARPAADRNRAGSVV
jgi:hypothetical protein